MENTTTTRVPGCASNHFHIWSGTYHCLSKSCGIRLQWPESTKSNMFLLPIISLSCCVMFSSHDWYSLLINVTILDDKRVHNIQNLPTLVFCNDTIHYNFPTTEHHLLIQSGYFIHKLIPAKYCAQYCNGRSESKHICSNPKSACTI